LEYHSKKGEIKMSNYLINSFEFDGDIHSFTLPYGVCGTAAATAAKTVTVSNFSLETGATVIVKFTNNNTASSPTLNVNSTGAKPIYRYGSTATGTSQTTTAWRAGAVQMFIYDGTGWIRDYWSNTTYTLKSFDITATATELNYTDGVTSNIQTQLDAKANDFSIELLKTLLVLEPNLQNFSISFGVNSELVNIS
jgi:hypothetical protein